MELFTITSCSKRTPSYEILCLNSKLRFKHIYALDGIPITTLQYFKDVVQQKCTQNETSCVITIVSYETLAEGIQTESIPQLYFDQVTLIHKYLDMIHPSTPVVTNLTCRKLEKQDDFKEWLIQNETKQHSPSLRPRAR